MTHTPDLSAALQDLAAEIVASCPAILQEWRRRVDRDSQIMASGSMTRSQFYDHIPRILQIFCEDLSALPSQADQFSHFQSARQSDMAQQHAQHRWQQGYNLRSLVREWGHLNSCMVQWLDSQQVETAALGRARNLWAETVNQNLSVGAVEHESLLQMEAEARLSNLEKALEAVRRMEIARAEMLREVSHDLQGGLTVVAGASSLLGSKAIGETDRAHVMTMLQEGVTAVSEMLTDLMDMSRLEAGREKLIVTSFDAGHLLLELWRVSQALAESKGLWLRYEGPASLRVEGDGTKVRRIAQNLLLNALKYTREGGVTIAWDVVDDDQWEFTITDTGPGLLGPAELPMLRELAEATQKAHAVGASPESEHSLDNEETKAHPSEVAPAASGQAPFRPLTGAGEGIGLSIVKRLCDLLHATLELETRPNEGSAFRVILPRSYPSK